MFQKNKKKKKGRPDSDYCHITFLCFICPLQFCIGLRSTYFLFLFPLPLFTLACPLFAFTHLWDFILAEAFYTVIISYAYILTIFVSILHYDAMAHVFEKEEIQLHLTRVRFYFVFG